MSELSTLRQTLAQLGQAWNQRNPRERFLLTLGAVLLAFVVLWSVALAPALQTWREAPARQAQLDAQSQKMLELQAQANNLKNKPPITRADAIQWLEKSLATLGPGAKINVQDERATLSLEAASPEALASWLNMARERALILPIQAQLKQTVTPPSYPQGQTKQLTMPPPNQMAQSNQFNLPLPSVQAKAKSKNEISWSGSLLLRLQ